MIEKIQMETSEIDLKDPRVFEAVFDTYYARVYSFALKLLEDDMASADIVQEAFLYIWQNVSYFSNVSSFKCYLYSCVKNKCLNYLRVERRLEELQDVYADEMQVEHLIIEQELRGRILEEINKLPRIKKDIMLLRLEGNSYDEISEILQLSINTIKTHKKQAYRNLKIGLSDCEKYINLFVFIIMLIKLFV